MTGRERPHAVGLWVVASAFTALMSFATAPTPLWGLFARRDGFGATTVTVAFAVMIIGAAAGLLLFGHLSDRYGRRRIIIPALLVSAASAATILIFVSLPGLLAGRVLTGLGVGLTAATATTYLHDLYHRAHPGRVGSPTPGLVASGASLTGLALGPLLAGSLAQWAPSALVTPFAVYLAVLGLFALLVLRYGPETVRREPGAARPPRFALRPGGRSAFVSAGTVAFSAFAVMGFFASFGAVMMRDVLGVSSFFVTGLVPFAMFAASALSQTVLARRLSARGKLLAGVVLFPVGLALTAAALFHPALALYTVAAAMAGSGAGLLFGTAMGMAMGAAAPASRAGVTAVFFTLAYGGMGVPPVLFSLVSQQAGLRPSMIGFAVVLSLGTLTAVALSRPSADRDSALAT
ncbi:MFS transporter [Streptomyces roseolus]|uniref:MFS transporter n=1 Tax=Streptomyces roseolus TaxID=67358 RepID=UPI0037893484